jgi:hypothetical protein
MCRTEDLQRVQLYVDVPFERADVVPRALVLDGLKLGLTVRLGREEQILKPRVAV